MTTVIRLTRELKAKVIEAMLQVADEDMTEAELSKIFFDTVQAQVVPPEKHVGYEKWNSVRNWLVPDFRTKAIMASAKPTPMANQDELQKTIKEILNKELQDIRKSVDDINKDIATRAAACSEVLEVTGKAFQTNSEKINVLASVVSELAKALKDVFVTLELQQHTLSVEVNKEIKRIAKEVMPTIEVVEDASDIRFSIVIIGLLPAQENVIKERFGKKFKLSFVTSQQAAKNKSMSVKYKNADVIIGMGGFISHSGSFNQFKNKLKTVHGGMTSLISELEALVNIMQQ